MKNFRSLLRQHQYTLLMLLLAGGFAVVLGELILYQHWDGVQLVGFLATVAGLLLVLIGMFAGGRLGNAVAVLLVILSLTGVIGAYEHYESSHKEKLAAAPARLESAATAGNQNVALRLAAAPQAAPAEEHSEEGEAKAGSAAGENRDEAETPPPPLAPLSLAGLALMGAIVVAAKPESASRRA